MLKFVAKYDHRGPVLSASGAMPFDTAFRTRFFDAVNLVSQFLQTCCLIYEHPAIFPRF